MNTVIFDKCIETLRSTNLQPVQKILQKNRINTNNIARNRIKSTK